MRSVLDMFLNAGHPDGMFQVQLEAASRQDAKQYQFLETKFAEIKASISDQIAIQDLQKQWLDLFPAEQRNNVWQALGRESALDPKAFKMDSFTAHQQRALTHTLQKMRTLGQKIDKEKDKISMKEFSKVEKKILEYGRIQQHENLRMQCCALWKKLLIQMRGQMEFLAGIGFSRSSYCLVVFNEMFFGKNTPFPSGVLQREIDQLSSRHPNKIFHVNFLNSAIVKPESCAAFLNTYKGRNALFDWEQVGDYDRYFQSLPQYNDLVPVLENISETFFQGNQLTYYRKSTYQTESDEDLQKEIFYMFGNGRDANALHGEASAVLMDSLATEICYDLHLGIRKQMASYPANLKILVVPSNTLPFNDENM
ncbi:MAG: hypothetical protein NTW22_00495, partial [Proteobacteria bacterium]|nr:hypothetical protein [Pseudomonadota bacterium]